MTKSKVHVVLASDANYRPGLEVTRASIERSCRSPERLVYHVFDETALEGLQGLDVFARYNTSRMPYLRLFLPEILKDLDWIVYSDVDTIWNRDICELWDEVETKVKGEGEGKAIYWVRDMRIAVEDVRKWFAQTGVQLDEERYACSGVCVMNLRKMRETNLRARALEIVRKYGTPPYADQDILNLLFNKDCGMLPEYWDVMKGINNWRVPAVYHITGIGRHFHDATPPIYPPQYQLWWNVRKRVIGGRWLVAGEKWRVSPRSRFLSALWPLRFLLQFLPLPMRERIFRQMFYARVLSTSH